jgi:hypothetical protein
MKAYYLNRTSKQFGIAKEVFVSETGIKNAEKGTRTIKVTYEVNGNPDDMVDMFFDKDEWLDALEKLNLI